MATLLTETFNGPYTVTGYPSGSVAGLDNPQSMWNDCAWHSEAGLVPYIDDTFPCPHGSNNSIVFRIDSGHLDAVQPWDIREWYFRWYMRLGDADDFSCTYTSGDETEVSWAKLSRLYGQSWAWNFLHNVTYDGDGSYLQQEVPTSVTLYNSDVWTPCKWYYNELYILLNTPGQSDGAWEFRYRNVIDNGDPDSLSGANLNLVNSLTQGLETLRIGGNRTSGNTPTNGIARYANIQLNDGDSTWIGEAGDAQPQVPTGAITLTVR